MIERPWLAQIASPISVTFMSACESNTQASRFTRKSLQVILCLALLLETKGKSEFD